MKVIHLISGDAKTHLQGALTGSGQAADVRLVCLGDGSFSDEARARGIPVTVLHSGNALCLRALRRLIRAEGRQLVHCHGTRAVMLGAMLRPLVRVPVLTTVQGDASVSGRTRLAALRLLDYQICVSSPLRQKLIDRNFAPDRLFTICRGLDFSREIPRADRSAFFASFGFSVAPKDVIVGAAVRPDASYDLPMLLRAVSLARKNGAGIRLAVSGSVKRCGELRALAASFGIGEDVFFLGGDCDPDAFFGAIDIHALPAVSDGLPDALAEGARAALATVAVGAGDVPELIDHGVNGFLTAPGDADGFAAALAELANRPDLRVRMGSGLREAGLQRLSLPAVGKRQLEIYDTILRREQWRRGKRDGVLICGAYGFGNAGDDAILEAILQEMRSIDPDMPVTVLSRRPAETRKVYGVPTMHSFNLPRMAHVMRRTQLYLNGGGNLMQDVTSRMSLWYYLFTLRCARRCGARVQMYGCGIGPIRVPGDRTLAARTINRNVDVITLREPESLEELRSLGIDRPEIRLAADPVIRLRAASAFEVSQCFAKYALRPDGRYIAFVVRRWQGLEDHMDAFAAAASHAYTRHGLTPVFVCINPRADLEATRQVAAHITVPHFLVNDPMSAALSIGFMSRMQAVVSMRLHGLVFGAIQGVPLAGVSYDPKVRAFLDYIEQDNYVELENADAQTMCALIDRAMSLSGQKDELRRRAELILARENNNRNAAARLLGRE